MKPMNKLTLKNLRLNKVRTLVTAVGILLSAALITAVAGMSMSFKQSLIHSQEISQGNFSVEMDLTSYDMISTARCNRNVESAYLVEELGVAKAPNHAYATMPYFNVSAVSEGAFDDCFSVDVIKGCLPETDSEIVLSEDVYIGCGKSLDVGDTVTLEIGARADENGNYITPSNDYGVTDEAYEKAYEKALNEQEATADEDDIDYERVLNSVEKIDETLTDTQTKTYTVVGIVSANSQPLKSTYNSASCGFAYTVSDESAPQVHCAESFLYITYTPETEADYMKNTAELLGISENQLKRVIEDSDEVSTRLLDNGVSFVFANDGIIKLHCDDLNEPIVCTLYSVAAVIITLVMIASVFVIKNSLAISITEKTKLYGMLASVGATRRQIRHNVLFEALILGALGIIPGVTLGVGVSALLVEIANRLLGSEVTGFEFVLCIPFAAIVTAVLVSALTVFLSAFFTAVRASKISPVDAIKGTADMKIKGADTPKKLKKALKTSRLTEKLFGIGGVVAAKNLKRNKRKYRATVISIVVSAALFISTSSFIDCTLEATSSYYDNINYTMSASILTKNQAETIAAMPECESSFIFGCNVDYVAQNDGISESVTIISLNDELFEEFVEENGLDFDDVKDGALLYDQIYYRDENDEMTSFRFYGGYSPTTITLSELAYDDGSGEKYKLSVSAFISEYTSCFSSVFDGSGIFAVVREDACEQLFNKDVGFDYNIYVTTTQNQVLKDRIREDITKSAEIIDYEEDARYYNSMVLLVEIFVYGFITVISLIGLTNIFNTVSTNVRLRSKEFAALKSVGMTKREFNRMIRLETLMYGAKSLLIGVPIGILGGLMIYRPFKTTGVDFTIDYHFPWLAVLITVLVVFVLLALIMRYSVSKVNKQNIIEMIRNDNV